MVNTGSNVLTKTIDGNYHTETEPNKKNWHRAIAQRTDANAFVYGPNPLEIQTSSYPSTCSLCITWDYFPLPENVQLQSYFVLRVYLCLEHFPSLSSIWDPTHLWRWVESPSFIHWIRMDCSISCTPAAYQILICIVTYLSVTSTSGIKWEGRHWGVLPAQQARKSTKLNPVSWIDEKYNFNFFFLTCRQNSSWWLYFIFIFLTHCSRG